MYFAFGCRNLTVLIQNVHCQERKCLIVYPRVCAINDVNASNAHWVVQMRKIRVTGLASC